MPMLLVANPYTTSNSLFSNIIPTEPPKIFKDVTIVTPELPYPIQIIEVGVVSIVVLLFVNLILYLFGVNTFKFIGTFILKIRRIKIFGKKVGDSELVTVLLNLLEVLGKQTDFKEPHTMSSLNNVVYKVETILTLLEIKDNKVEQEVFTFIDLGLTHEKFLMEKLINYMTDNKSIRERIVEESLNSIGDGLERVLEEYVNKTAKTVEDELSIYNDLKEKQKEQNFDDLIRRD